MSFRRDLEFDVRVPDFSDENIHTPGSAGTAEMTGNESQLSFSIILPVYANGMNAAEKGYVSLVFTGILNSDSGDGHVYGYDISCVISVIDASGDKRFPTSYVFFWPRTDYITNDESLKINRLIKRETLLNEPDELLPEDCLTLHFHITVDERIRVPHLEDDIQLQYWSWDLTERVSEVPLLLESELGRRLIEASPYFRGLSESPMVEKQRGYATFPIQEVKYFTDVGDILLGRKRIYINSLLHLGKIYVLADKYVVPVVVESCKRILSVLLQAAENDCNIKEQVMDQIPDLIELAAMHKDIRLKEIAESFLERNCEDNDKDILTVESTADDLETEWRLEEFGERRTYFILARGSREDNFRFYQ